MPIEYDCDLLQDTDEWRSKKRGLISGSVMKLLITEKTKKIADNDKVRGIIFELAAQRLQPQLGEDFQSWDMLRGKKEEILAKDLYSKNYAQVKDCGLIINDDLGFKICCSPDGLVGADGGIEGKSRMSKFQVQTIIEGVVPDEFMCQVQGNLLVSGRKWWDFLSYSNGMHMFVKRVEPLAVWQDPLKEAIIAAEKKIQEIVTQYQEKTKDLVLAPWLDVMSGEDGAVKPSRPAIDPADALSAG